MFEVGSEPRQKQASPMGPAPSHAAPSTPTAWAASARQTGRPHSSSIALQRALGNRALGRILQTKLEINHPGDVYEQEADRVADQVMQSGSALPDAGSASPAAVQRKCAPCETSQTSCPKCDEEETKVALQRGEVASAPATAPPSVDAVVNSQGKPLDASTRGFMERQFGHSFEQVRIHADQQAADSASTVGAMAYTVGSHVAFAAGRHDPASTAGRHLLAHELTHVIQQGYAPPFAEEARDGPRVPSPSPRLDSAQQRVLVSGAMDRKLARAPADAAKPTTTGKVGYVALYFGPQEEVIDLHTDDGLFRYHLDSHSELGAGEYSATVTIEKNNVSFSLNVEGGQLFEFAYKVEAGKPNPVTLFKGQAQVTITVVTDDPPPLTKTKDQPEDAQDPNVTTITPEEALSRCESGDLPGVKVFPFRGTRFGGAPITARRDGDDIIVKSYVYVFSNPDFKAQTRTLPIETFIGGVRLKRNELVRVHTYEPRWYHLNITGSTSGDIENEFCVTGEGMLEIAHRSDIAVAINIGLTVIDAATLFIPVGKIATIIGKPVVGAVARSGSALAIAAMLGLREAAPTAFAGIASRGVVVLEEQAVDQVAGKAISSSASHAIFQFSEEAVAPTVARAAGEATVEKGTSTLAGAASQGVARTVTVTVVDGAGHQTVSRLTTPTGNRELDREIDEAFSQTFDTSRSQAASQAAGQGVTAAAPEITAGFTQAQVAAFRKVLGRSFTSSDINILSQLWDDAARAGDNAILNAGNSRYLFDLQRNRFWTRVAANPQASALFTDAGCQFSGGAPYYVLNGRRIVITIDHIFERQSSPQLALTASNLRLSFSRENSVVLRLLNQLDPFQQ